jgi:hypothetical protein
MTGTPHIYYIFYGNWGTNTALTLLPDYAQHLSGSPYYNINTTYTNGGGTHLSNLVTYNGAYNDAGSHGLNLSDADVLGIVSGAITGAHLPSDAQGVYFVLTAANVTETSGYCTAYCAWHNHATIGATDIKYAFVGNPDACPTACEGMPGNAPNGNAGADAMAATLGGELSRTVTDPDFNAWYDAAGNENADKCGFTFGTTHVYLGQTFNIHLGTRNWLLQQNWVNDSGGYCSVFF